MNENKSRGVKRRGSEGVGIILIMVLNEEPHVQKVLNMERVKWSEGEEEGEAFAGALLSFRLVLKAQAEGRLPSRGGVG